MLVKTRPFENNWMNRLEIFNETIVLCSIYWLYFFMGLIPDPEVAYEASNMLTFLIYSVMSFNFLA